MEDEIRAHTAEPEPPTPAGLRPPAQEGHPGGVYTGHEVRVRQVNRWQVTEYDSRGHPGFCRSIGGDYQNLKDANEVGRALAAQLDAVFMPAPEPYDGSTLHLDGLSPERRAGVEDAFFGNGAERVVESSGARPGTRQ